MTPDDPLAVGTGLYEVETGHYGMVLAAFSFRGDVFLTVRWHCNNPECQLASCTGAVRAATRYTWKCDHRRKFMAIALRLGYLESCEDFL